MSAVATHVRWITSGDVTLLLDIRAGTLSALDGAASVMWSAFASGADDRTVSDTVAQRFNALQSRIGDDVAAFRHECEKRELLTTHDEATPARRPAGSLTIAASTAPSSGSLLAHLPAKLHAALSGARMRWHMRRGRMHHAYALAVRASTLPSKGEWSPSETQRLAAAYSRGDGTLVSGGATGDCLPRSLALYVFLRERGVPATHVIGVTPRPFAAHAWVEVDGRSLYDDAERTRAFLRLAVLS